ncbi:MAG: glycosyltransferase family 2 protein [Candidatus Omnitrophota bacterium]
MNKLQNLSIFFPAYNEEENIVQTVEKALEVMPSFAENFEIIIVNDGSKDRTKELAEELAKKHENVRVVSHEKNRGYGGALKTGFVSAKYENIFYSDGDGQFELKEIERLLPLVPECNIAAGFRIKRNDPIHRVINGKAYNLLVRLLFGLNMRDIDCAFKIVKKKVVDSIPLKSESQFVSAELLIKAKKQGFKIKQVGVHHFPREKGKPTGNSIRAIIGSFSELFKLWKELR